MELNALLKLAVEKGASDLHLQAGVAPRLRIGGQMQGVDAAPLTNEQMLALIGAALPPGRAGDIQAAAVEGLNFSYAMGSTARFRCSAYCTLGRLGMALRTIGLKIPAIDELHVPRVAFDIAMSGRGLTVVTGSSGGGKSTTLAAMIDLINSNEPVTIVTIEEPIEYLHESKQAFVTQLEVGRDTPSFEQGLRQALRQDAEIIMIGDLGDVETLRLALRAADTGRQVFAAMSTARAVQTIERIISMFPPAEHKVLLSQFGALEAILSQRLITTRDEGKRRPAMEVLRGGPVVERLILEDHLAELASYMESGESGMQSLDQHLLQMYNEKAVSGTEALRCAAHSESLAIAMRGIKYIGSGTKYK